VSVPVSNKVLISFAAAIALFAVFMALAYAGLFDPAAAGFYNPSIVKTINRDIEEDTGTVQDFLRELQNRFSAALDEPAVRHSFLPNRSAGDILERSRLFNFLLNTQNGLQSVRFIDAGGARIHYSTYSADILSQAGGLVSYRNYNSGADEISFETVAAPSGGGPRIIPDEKRERLIFSLPFYDSRDAYRGTALFSLSIQAVSERLIREGRVNAGENVSILQSPAGIVLGLPDDGKDAIVPAIASIWRLQLLNLTSLEPAETGTSLALISSRTDQGLYVGRLVDGAVVSFPPFMRIILPAAFFCTAYLTIFLLFNFRQDAMTIVQARIKSLQTTLIEEYHNRKGPVDWTRWGRELEQRREMVRMEIKRDIKGRRGKRLDKEIDACINSAWADLVAIIRSGAEPPVPVFNEGRIEEIVKRVLRTAGGNAVSGGRSLVENQGRLETVTGTQVSREKRLGVSGGRIMASTRNPAAKNSGTAEDTIKAKKLTSEKEKEKVPKDDLYEAKRNETGEVPEELEELEELEDLEELEELGAPGPAARPAEETAFPANPSGEDISVLAREIEFTPLPEDETGSAGGNSLSNLEIVSPFVTMLSDLDDGSEVPADKQEKPSVGKPENKEEEASGPIKAAPAKTSKLEILDGNYQMSLVYRPFTLENIPPQDLGPAEPVIRSRNGVNYINAAALGNEADIPLDKDFQRLVNSVLL
jgi:hypothetical protein